MKALAWVSGNLAAATVTPIMPILQGIATVTGQTQFANQARVRGLFVK
jgi:hypothetical protein